MNAGLSFEERQYRNFLCIYTRLVLHILTASFALENRHLYLPA